MECDECGSKMHVCSEWLLHTKDECQLLFQVAGPMWSGPLHDRDFVEEVLKLVKETPNAFGTSTRMHGMLTVASEVLNFMLIGIIC